MSLILINTLWFILFFICSLATDLDKGELTQLYSQDKYFKMENWFWDRWLPPASLKVNEKHFVGSLEH